MKRFTLPIALLCCLSCVRKSSKPEIVYDKNQPQIEWAVARLNDALTGITTDENTPKIFIKSESLDKTNEGYQLKVDDGLITITGNDLNGTMYGILSLQEQLLHTKDIHKIKPIHESARFPFRAIKVNLPWDSYRRSEALQLHMKTMQDLQYWEHFLDMMAKNRFNVLTLWNLHPFNYMIRPTNFPEACGFSDQEMKKWHTFWSGLFKMARERGIETYIVNWNIFVSPEFAAHYKVAEYSKEGAFFTDGDTSAIVKRYTRECVTQLINEYPDLTGLGVTLGEGMGAMTPRQREEWLLETIIQGARDSNRKIKFIHRVPLSADKGSGGSTDKRVEVLTRETLDTLSCFEQPIWTELKFNWSHAHSSPKLIKVHGGPLTDTYWNPEPTNYKINWMMRNEDFFILRWGQSDFIRQHIKKNGHPYVGGYYIGSECYYPAVDYFTKMPDFPWQYAFERQWLFYKQWGRLLYNPDTPEQVFEQSFTQKYNTDGKIINQATNLVGIVPLQIATFYNATWDFTLYSEGFLGLRGHKDGPDLITVEDLIKTTPLDPDYLSIPEYVALRKQNMKTPTGKTDPLRLADMLEANCHEALTMIQNTDNHGNIGLTYELIDIRVWANLGLYFADKLRAGVALHASRSNLAPTEAPRAADYMIDAVAKWENIVQITRPAYKAVPLTHLNNSADHYFHWAKYENKVQAEAEIIINATH